MRRWAFNIAVAISLLLLAADLGMDVRGSFYADQFTRIHSVMGATGLSSTRWIVHTSGQGILVFKRDGFGSFPPGVSEPPGVQTRFEHERIDELRDDITPFRNRFRLQPRSSQYHNWVMIEWAAGSSIAVGGSSREKLVVVPQITILGVLMIPLTVLMVKRYRAQERRRMGQCSRCGYNLTGNASGVCPECGAAVSMTTKGIA